MTAIRDTAIEAIAAYLVDHLNSKGQGLTVVESVGFTNTYFNKLFGGFPLLNIWRSRRYHAEGYLSGTTVTIHYLLASAADYQQIPGILDRVACWTYEAMRDYSQQCPLIKFEPESYESSAKTLTFSGTKGTTELPVLVITFDIMDSHVC